MKVDAYRCDNCGEIKIEKYIVCIIPTEDLFSRIDSYPIAKRLNESNVHFCLDKCFRDVQHKAGYEAARFYDEDGKAKVLRHRDEALYKQKLKELTYGLKQTCINNVRAGKKIFP